VEKFGLFEVAHHPRQLLQYSGKGLRIAMWCVITKRQGVMAQVRWLCQIQHQVEMLTPGMQVTRKIDLAIRGIQKRGELPEVST
jgi:hypothetical protein